MKKASLAAIMLAAWFIVSQAQAQVEPIPFRAINDEDGPPAKSSSSYTWQGRTPLAACDGNPATQWMSSGNATSGEGTDSAPWIAFYFDDLYELDRMTVWNFSEADGGRGMKIVNVYVSATGNDNDWKLVLFSVSDGEGGEPAFKDYVQFGNGVYPEYYEDGTWAWALSDPDTIQFDAGVVAKAVKFQILSNQDNNVFGPTFIEPSSNGTIAGMAEVLFYGTKVPEPATMSLLALGGAALLRRKR